MNEWIDGPVINIITYFDGLLGTYTYYAVMIARFLFLLSLVWGGIQLALGTLEVRKYVVENVVHLFCFLLVLNLFPAFCSGLMKFSNSISMGLSGKSIAKAEETLNDLYNELESIAFELVNKNTGKWQAQKNTLDKKIKKMEQSIINFNKPEVENNHYYSENPGQYEIQKEVQKNKLNALENQKSALEKKIVDYKKSVKVRGVTLNALESVLVNNTYDESGNLIDQSNITRKYNRKLKLSTTVRGQELFSPAAMMKVMIFCSEMMMAKAWSDDDDAGKNAWKTFTGNLTRNKIMELIMTMIVCIASIIICSFVLIQYIMCILEYVITSGISLLIVPCLLFDGLKDMVNKILPSLLAQVVKLIMINICMFFTLNQFMDLALNSLYMEKGFSFQSCAYTLFSLLLTLTLASNAPKIAATLLTGSPQMSMGEFVQAAGAAAAGGALAAKGVSTAGQALKTGNQWAQNAVMAGANRVGDFAAMGAAAKTTSGLAKENGQSGFKAGAGAFFNEAGHQIKTRMAKGVSDWAHGGGKKGSGGTGGRGTGSGESAYAFTSKDAAKSSEALKHSMDFGSAMNYDQKGNVSTRQSMGEYIQNRSTDAAERAKKRFESGMSAEQSQKSPQEPGTGVMPWGYGDYSLNQGSGPRMRNVTPENQKLEPPKRRLVPDKGSNPDVTDV